MSSYSVSASETKRIIYNLIEKIITYEDQIKSYQNNSAYKTAKEDLAKNKENIVLLTQFIKNEIAISNEKISQKNSEIANLKSKLENIHRPQSNYTKKDYEQNLLKQKCFEKTLWIYNNEYNTIQENISMLKEEKQTNENALVYLMSLKETYEETLNSFAKFIFKNLIISYDNFNSISVSTSISSFSSINSEIESFELVNISITKISNYIFDYILSKYITSLDQAVKSNVKKIMEGIYEQYVKGRIKINDFLRNTAINITNSDNKLINFIDVQKFEMGIRFVIKLFFFENSINDRLNFVNNQYKNLKNSFKLKRDTIKGKIDLIQKKMDEEQVQGKEINLEFANVKKFENNIEEIKNQIEDKEKEIEMIMSEKDRNIKNYRKEIKELEELNKVLEFKYDGTTIEKQIKEMKSKIDEIFIEIKNKIKECDTENDNILNILINDINISLTPPKNEAISPNDVTQEINNISQNNSNILETLTCQMNKDVSISSKNSTIKTYPSKQKSNMSTLTNTQGNNYTLPPMKLNFNSIEDQDNVNTNHKASRQHNNTIQNYNTIEPSKENNINDIIDKLKPLYSQTECYINFNENPQESNTLDYNPLADYDNIPEEKNFAKALIQLEKDNQILSIKQITKEELNININLIDKTIVNGIMKTIINVIQIYQKKYKRDIKLLLNDKEFIEKELKMTKDYVLKCVYPKYYFFTIMLNVNKKINVLFLNYQSFKLWLNGMACIIKNKKRILFS